MIGPERQLTPATHAVMETLRNNFPDQLADLESCNFRFYPEGFSNTVRPPYANGDGYYGMGFCGMFVGIEPDGYAHS